MIINDVILWLYTIFFGIVLLVFFFYSLCLLIDMALDLRDRILTLEEDEEDEEDED